MKAKHVSDLTKKTEEAATLVRRELSQGQTTYVEAYLNALAEEHKERMVSTSEPTLSQARIKLIRDISHQLWPT